MSNQDRYCLLSNDVETTSVYFNKLSPESGLKVLKEGMPLLLDLYSTYNIKTTFFFCIDIVKVNPSIVKMVLPYGHEVASHGYSHEVNEAFDVINYAKQLQHLVDSKKILEDISGQEVISFRAPALRFNKYTPVALAEAGYKIDSSVPSQRFDFFLSFGAFKKLKWLTAPRLPYRTIANDLTRKGNGPLLEIPLSACIFPYIGTTMRIFPQFTKIQRNLLHIESKLNNKPLVFNIHPNEFIDESDQPRTIERRVRNPVSYLLGDLIRSQLKIKNLGPKALPLYEDLIKFCFQNNYNFGTIKDYAATLNI